MMKYSILFTKKQVNVFSLHHLFLIQGYCIGKKKSILVALSRLNKIEKLKWSKLHN